MEYELNEQACFMGDDLVKTYHSRLNGIRIAYLFKQKPEPKTEKVQRVRKPLRQGKRVTLAKASLIPKKYTELLALDYKFVIEFDRERWDELTLPQQEALVDHELCHCGNDADGCYLRHHDLEEFREIVERHGFWKDDIRQFAESIEKQGTLAL